ncbi:MAG: hypothetical protein ACYC6F_15555 [Longimicrobiales bacterium]
MCAVRTLDDLGSPDAVLRNAAAEGELWLLERRWKEAEEIAAISDSLLLPEGTEEFLEKRRAPGGG